MIAPDPQISLERETDGGFVATSPALPGFVARGDSEASAMRRMRRALRHLARDQGREFESWLGGEGADAPFRWSRWRAPLALRLPLSRAMKTDLSLFGAGLAAGFVLLTVSRRRS